MRPQDPWRLQGKTLRCAILSALIGFVWPGWLRCLPAMTCACIIVIARNSGLTSLPRPLLRLLNGMLLVFVSCTCHAARRGYRLLPRSQRGPRLLLLHPLPHGGAEWTSQGGGNMLPQCVAKSEKKRGESGEKRLGGMLDGMSVRAGNGLRGSGGSGSGRDWRGSMRGRRGIIGSAGGGCGACVDPMERARAPASARRRRFRSLCSFEHPAAPRRFLFQPSLPLSFSLSLSRPPLFLSDGVLVVGRRGVPAPVVGRVDPAGVQGVGEEGRRL